MVWLKVVRARTTSLRREAVWLVGAGNLGSDKPHSGRIVSYSIGAFLIQDECKARQSTSSDSMSASRYTGGMTCWKCRRFKLDIFQTLQPITPH